MHLHDHIETIQPTNSFLRMRAKARNLRIVEGDFNSIVLPESQTASKSVIADACNATAVTPKCLRTLYGSSNRKLYPIGY